MKKILIVDDDEDLVLLASDLLTTKGYRVLSHRSGLSVSNVVRQYNPDLILLDIRLYGSSGTEISKELKAWYDMPIILFSGDTTKGKAFADCDADGFLQKPFTSTELLRTISRHLEHTKAMA